MRWPKWTSGVLFVYNLCNRTLQLCPFMWLLIQLTMWQGSDFWRNVENSERHCWKTSKLHECTFIAASNQAFACKHCYSSKFPLKFTTKSYYKKIHKHLTWKDCSGTISRSVMRMMLFVQQGVVSGFTSRQKYFVVRMHRIGLLLADKKTIWTFLSSQK